MVLSVKMSCFFLILFFKGPQFKDKLPFSNLKCPFFCRIPLNRSKKWLGDKKMRVTHHLLGIWPQKHSQSSMHQLKTHFGVNSPLFQLKCSVLFSGIMINWLKNLLSEKKLAVTHQIMGIWPIKHLQNTEKRNFLQYCNEKDLHMGFWDPQHLSLIESGQTKVFFTTFLMKMGFWRPFRGHIPIFWWGTPTFFPLKIFLS